MPPRIPIETSARHIHITKEDFVLEIGPGIGTMTQYLCESARKVIAVEIDCTLIPILKDTLSDYDNITVINEDILKVDNYCEPIIDEDTWKITRINLDKNKHHLKSS